MTWQPYLEDEDDWRRLCVLGSSSLPVIALDYEPEAGRDSGRSISGRPAPASRSHVICKTVYRLIRLSCRMLEGALESSAGFSCRRH